MEQFHMTESLSKVVLFDRTFADSLASERRIVLKIFFIVLI